MGLFTDDVHYWMVARTNRYPRSSKAIAILDADRYADEDLAARTSLVCSTRTSGRLTARVARLDTGMAWAEDPPSRTRHVITNIEIAPDASGRS